MSEKSNAVSGFTGEDARHALIGLVSETNDEVLRAGLKQLKEARLQFIEDDWTGDDAWIALGRWKCNLTKRTFVLTLSSEFGLVEYIGVFRRSDNNSWNAIITEEKRT